MRKKPARMIAFEAPVSNDTEKTIMRIVFIKQKYVSAGGGEGYLARLMSACREGGHDVHLITTGWPGEGFPRDRVHVVSLPGTGAARRARRFSDAAANIIARQGFDLSVSLERTARQQVWRAGEGVHRVWLERRARIESPLRARLASRLPRHRALLELEACCVRDTPLLIANSDMVRRDLERVYGTQHGRIEVIRNGVDMTRFHPRGREKDRARERETFGVLAGRPLLLFVGSGFRRKGLAESLAALRFHPDATLVVLGRDKPAAWQRLATRLGVAGRVRFAGTRRDTAPCYRAADAVLLPSWFDPFPNAGLEALSCGTPLVTTRFAGICEAVREGVNGCVIDAPDDGAALSAAIGRTLAPARSQDASEAIAASVASYALPLHVRRMVRAFLSVAGQ